MRQVGIELEKFAIRQHEKVTFDPNTKFLFGNIDARLDGEHHAWLEHRWILSGIVYVYAEHMSEAVQPVFAERLAMQILAMRDDVVEGNRVKGIGIAMTEVVDHRLACHERFDG